MKHHILASIQTPLIFSNILWARLAINFASKTWGKTWQILFVHTLFYYLANYPNSQILEKTSIWAKFHYLESFRNSIFTLNFLFYKNYIFIDTNQFN